ncbi:acetyl ornithine aminotransferase family protein [Ferroplasma acidiphilum]|jgi:4-aminobutyrate aminotransferase|uniref:acetyl ornithine aminotransferase family protein n=1 Tax=Ferroplasma acidiphilum TaxID=74969 RepID=UPI0023F004DF|nr:acetyl ornithine aminotransferase family protein [Ferroplasma acidiphilum]MCL4349381.1 acetyl ornithine aminotransferase family protein [Candidatus Thermoplasmatota archaeon]WMT52904.1 MAG: acetyl ornithine aminotransferase family protein [Ferroplasma acidiphilum]
MEKDVLLNGVRITTELPGPNAKKIMAEDEKYLTTSTKSLPVVAYRGQGCYIEDVDDNVFLDFSSGISTTNIGYGNEYVISKVQEQLHKLWHFAGTDFYYEEQVEAAKALIGVSPGSHDKKVFYANSGAESNEASLKLARSYTKRPQFIGFIGGFHGRTMGALSFTASQPVHHEGFFPEMGGVTHIPFPDPYRNPFNIDGYEEPEDLTNAAIDYLEDYVFGKFLPSNSVAAILVEPIQGEGGYIVPPMDFHKKLMELAHENEILYIMDEVQTGFGRTGRFFASEHFGVDPDIMSVAKSIASGIPMGASVVKSKYDFEKSGLHSNTFGGNLLASVSSRATIEEIKNKNMVENARKVGDYLNKRLHELQEKYDSIGDVRGLGLMQAIDFVKNRKTKAHFRGLRDKTIENAYKNGLILLGAGESAIRFIPPLIVNEKQIDEAIDILDNSIKKAL